MKVLITGITGFIGFHLLQELAQHACEIHGVARHQPSSETCDAIPSPVVLHKCDITDFRQLAALVRSVAPDCIYHLAGQASMSSAWRSPAATFETNVTGTLALLEAVSNFHRGTRVLISGSCHQYGAVREEELPIAEAARCRPVSPYGTSKTAQECLALQYFRSDGLPVVIARTFNPVGPRQPETFVCSNLARQLAQSRRRKSPVVLKTGPLESVRDFLDVRDVARAYALLIERGEPGEVYNVCSGQGVSTQQVIELLERISGVACRPQVVSDRFRRAEVRALVGSNAKIRSAIGWEPKFSLERSLSDLWKHWASRVEEVKRKHLCARVI